MLIYTIDGSRLAAVLAIALIVSCAGPDNKTAPAPFTDDENYLIESYVEVRRARSFYAYDVAEAESLFTHLEAKIDTVRIARATAALNSEPDRWLDVFAEIERRLKPGNDTSEEP